MSLVNKMLKDLEKRQKQSPNGDPHQPLGHGTTPPTPSTPNRLIYIVLICATIVLLFTIGAVFLKTHHKLSALTAKIEHLAHQQPNSVQSPVKDQPLKTSPSTTAAAVPAPTPLAQTASPHTTASPTPPLPSSPSENNTHAPNSEPPYTANAIPTDGHVTENSHSPAPPSKTPLAAESTMPAPSSSNVHIHRPALSQDQRLANAYNNAMQSIHNDRSEKAIHQLSMILEHAPYYKNARVSLAALLLRQHKTAEAKAVLQVGLDHDPKDPDYVKLSAYILMQEGSNDAALQLLIAAKPSDLSSAPNYFALMASLYMIQQDYGNAKPIYQQLVNIAPLNSTWWAALGIASDKLGLVVGARKAFDQASKLGGLTPALQQYIDHAND